MMVQLGNMLPFVYYKCQLNILFLTIIPQCRALKLVVSIPQMMEGWILGCSLDSGVLEFNGCQRLQSLLLPEPLMHVDH
jgi:hypothetical protein